MQLHKTRMVWITKAVLASAVLGGFLLFAGAPGAKADDRDDHRYSPQANEWRHDRYQAERVERQRQEWREQEWREHERAEHRDYEHRDYDRRDYHDRDRY